MTVDNVSQVMIKTRDKSKMMDCDGLDIPTSVKEWIKTHNSTDEDQIRQCADYYVNCLPDASWEHLNQRLYFKGEFAAAKKCKTFISTGKLINLTCAVEYLMSSCQGMYTRCISVIDKSSIRCLGINFFFSVLAILSY